MGSYQKDPKEAASSLRTPTLSIVLLVFTTSGNFYNAQTSDELNLCEAEDNCDLGDWKIL
jgi:hypothetical protein